MAEKFNKKFVDPDYISHIRVLSYVVSHIALGIHQPRAPPEFTGALTGLLPCQGEPAPGLHQPSKSFGPGESLSI